ncbi:MAG: proline--tRNA ligase [Candidatus Aenigmatarchaeota archaeon]
MAEQEGITVKKNENFSEWYTQVVLKSKLADYGPVQGTIVFREYSYEIWEKIQSIFDKMIKNTGHKNAYFPLLIPESFLKKEAEHFKGFVPEVFWVTHAGDDKLGERLAIRPTSETIIYYFFSRWIRSWRDLPVLLNQWCNILRAEIKSTKPFIRTSEFLWQEGHTAHATKEEADKEVMLILNFYKDLIENYLAIPVLVGKKTEREKFAGALYTTTLEAIMPDGKALQMGTSHNLGQNFSKPFEIKFMDKDKKEKYVWTTSWGIATRLIGAIIMAHGDDKGLIIPPKVAPYKVVIVPIYYKEKEKEKIMKKCSEVQEILQRNSIETIFDKREEYTPGWKFNEWELKGIPLRIEIGPKDVEKKQIVLVRRDTNEKIVAKEKEIVEKTLYLLEEIQKNLFKKAKKFLEEHITTVKDYKEFKEKLEEKGGFIRACWCESEECEAKIKEETGATIRLIPFEKEKIFSSCVYCGKKAKKVAYFAKSY